jgi:hypothetical protein
MPRMSGLSPGMTMIWFNVPKAGLMTYAAKSSMRARCPEGGVVGSCTASRCPEGGVVGSCTASFSWAVGSKSMAIKAGATGPRSA